MNSSFFIILSFLLATAILVPSVISLIDIEGKKALVMDFNEEENKKEENKEVSEKDFFLSFKFHPLSEQYKENSKINCSYIEWDYFNSIDIFLPPPEHRS